MSDDGPPAWFWKLLDDARPSLQALATALEALPKEKLIAWAFEYDEAMLAVCEPWAGPEVDDIQFSEDDTEDFTEWVVGQGYDLWQRAIDADDLAPLVREYWERERKSWDTSVTNRAYRGYQSCRGIATVIFSEVHGSELADALEVFTPSQ